MKHSSKVAIAAFLIGSGTCHSLILSYAWHPFQPGENNPRVDIFPVGLHDIDEEKVDIALKATMSKYLGLEFGIQTVPAYSCYGFYAGPRTDYFQGKYGFGATLSITAFLFNAAASFEHVGEPRFGLSVGVGLPWIIFPIEY